jgi:hypothetical protein
MTARPFHTYRSARRDAARVTMYQARQLSAATSAGTLEDSFRESKPEPKRPSGLELWRAKSRANAISGQDHATAKMLFNDRKRRSGGRWYSGKPR